MINWSISLVLNNSVTGSNSEEAITLFSLIWFHIIWLDGELGSYFILLLVVGELIENIAVFDSSVFEEHVKC